MKEVKLPEGIELRTLADNYRVASTEYSQIHKRMRVLDMADNNKLWQAVAAKFPKYQILPETNHVSYIKNNLLASVYTIGKCADILPTSEQDKDIITNINVAMEHVWTQLDVAKYQMEAGERAALLNIGITQVGWDNSLIKGGEAFDKGRCKLKNINPMQYMRDPFAENLDTASYVMVWEEYHASVIRSNPLYKDTFKAYEAKKIGSDSTYTPDAPSDRVSSNAAGRQDYYKVFTHWVRVGDKIHEIHTINNNFLLHVKEDIRPSMFPFAELYCNLPVSNIVGNSEPNKIFANSVAYNIMNSILLTAEHKNQNPPKFVNAAVQMNIAAFTKHGNEADKTFVVNGDASKAVHYHQFPAPTQAALSTMGILSQDIQNITGIDGRYTGRDTGSILTTGGINSMLDQVTMIDAPKVENYERYCKRLTQLILSNYIQLSSFKRKYFFRDKDNPKVYKTVEVDFPEIDDDTLFEYEISISSMLPKNRTMLANIANKLMEMQMQYSSQNIEADLITPQEWLMMQDLPMKEYMLERMNIQRTANWTEAVSQIINQYASLTENGVDPMQAMLATADTMQAQSQPGGGFEDVAQNLAQGGIL